MLEKNLDTPDWRLIRFPQKVLTALPPLELFSLEEKAACVAGWPFRLRPPACSFRETKNNFATDFHGLTLVNVSGLELNGSQGCECVDSSCKKKHAPRKNEQRVTDELCCEVRAATATES